MCDFHLQDPGLKRSARELDLWVLRQWEHSCPTLEHRWTARPLQTYLWFPRYQQVPSSPPGAGGKRWGSWINLLHSLSLLSCCLLTLFPDNKTKLFLSLFIFLFSCVCWGQRGWLLQRQICHKTQPFIYFHLPGPLSGPHI